MELSQRQLSKQDHYDYGLRSFVIPIARAAGAMKRVEPDLPEDVILQRAMRDLIKPKLIFADLPLFNALLSDLFPGVELTPKEASDLKRAIENQLRLAGMQVVAPYVTKIIQVKKIHTSFSLTKLNPNLDEKWSPHENVDDFFGEWGGGEKSNRHMIVWYTGMVTC